MKKWPEKPMQRLIELDPTKEGYEPWKDVQEDIQADSLEQDREFLLGKIHNDI